LTEGERISLKLDSTIPRPASIRLMDFEVNPISSADVVSLVAEAIRKRQKWIIGNHNLHSVYLWYHEPRMRLFYEAAEFIHIDGMPLILLANLLGVSLRRENRATSLDFFPILASRAAKENWRIFYLGSKPGVACRAAAKLSQSYPGLQMLTRHGYFNTDKLNEENQRVVAEVNAYAPHVLMVGMGMPLQEKWILENRGDVCANVIFSAGALMDYVAGEKPTPPRWLATLCLEWMYRLCSEPRRLWRRYLVEPWFVVVQVAKYLYSERLRQTAENRRRTSTGR